MSGSPSTATSAAVDQGTYRASCSRLLKRLAQSIELIAARPHSGPMRSRMWMRYYLSAVAVTLVCTAIAFPLAAHVDLINVVMIYLLGAAIAGLLFGRGPSALTAVTNILAFDYFFVPPLFSFQVFDRSYLVTFAVMLLVALIVANLMIAVRAQTEAADAREQHTAALYAITRKLAIVRDADTMIITAIGHIGDVLQARAHVCLYDESGQIIPQTGQCPSGRARFLPLRGSHALIGMLVVDRPEPNCDLLPEQQRLLQAIADQLALALERVHLAELAHAAHLAAERAAMRNTLLASISHDLRTPLSAIAGAGSIMAQPDFALDVYRRETLGRLIEDKARDMSDLLTNVLELVRLESGAGVIHRDWHALGDLIGIAIQRQESRLMGWQLTTDVPGELPLLSVDANLVVQLISNLLENAIKYTPAGTRICISACHVDAGVRLVVEDSGPGLGMDAPDQLFEKFTRGRREGTTGGVGLGLAICRAVARLHGGDIRGTASPMGGARFEITLPGVDAPRMIETESRIA
jgi:two-component system sensor histidine kinase KdpD